jgi:hypothetical protein
VTERFTFNIGPGDRLLWVLEKLDLAASQLEADAAPIQERLERALLEMVSVQPADLPHDLREQLDPARRAMSEVSLLMTTAAAEAVGQAILRLRGEVKRRIDLGAPDAQQGA